MFFICTSKRLARSTILTVLALLLIVAGCGSSQSKGTNPTPTPPNDIVIFPTCRQASCITPTNGTISSEIPGVRPFIDTLNNIHLFLSFDYKIPHPATIASHYDFVWGADVDNVSAFRSANPKMFITYYIPFNRDTGSFTDQNATHDLGYWKSVHPDWILYKCDRVTPAYVDGEPNIPFDFTNPDVLSWQLQTYAQPASRSGYDGIDADNLNLENLSGACGSYKNGVWVQRYTGQVDDQQWITDTITWLTRMQQALHSLPHPLALIPNLSLAPLTPDDPQVQHLLQHIDGVLDEGGFTKYSQGYLTDEKWVQHVKFIQAVQAMHKPFYIVNQFPPPSVTTDEIQWALSSYLMSKENLSAVFISSRQAYGGDTRYDEYNAPIGKPINEMYLDQHVYWRDYSNGRVVVNPSATDTYTVSMNVPSGHFVDLYGNHIGQTITLPPHSGIVLLTG